MWQTATAWPAARAAANAAGLLTSPGLMPPTNRRRISWAVLSSPRAYARARAMATRGRSSSGASASNNPRTRSAQSATHAATRRRSASLSVCGDLIRREDDAASANRSARCHAARASRAVRRRWMIKRRCHRDRIRDTECRGVRPRQHSVTRRSDLVASPWRCKSRTSADFEDRQLNEVRANKRALIEKEMTA